MVVSHSPGQNGGTCFERALSVGRNLAMTDKAGGWVEPSVNCMQNVRREDKNRAIWVCLFLVDLFFGLV